MENKYDISVVVVTYNPSWDKLKLTLDAILQQTYKEYEIIVADDGSKDNLHEKTEAYFAEKGFTDYTMVMNPENQGTVKNLLSGVKVAKGKYIRGFGTGDMFYSENSMAELVAFMDQTGCEGCFGRMRGFYYSDDGKIHFNRYTFPFDLECYRNDDEERILKNLIVYSDNVSGAAMSFRREYILEYLQILEGRVIYLEDVFQVMAALDGRRLQFFDRDLIWYECDEGISTNSKSGFRLKLMEDRDKFYEYLFERYPDSKWLKLRKRLMGIYRINNAYIRMLLSALKNPSVIAFLARHYLQIMRGTYDKSDGDGFLERGNAIWK